jgi:hypothetical protein
VNREDLKLSMEQIKPDEMAEERMLANIMRSFEKGRKRGMEFRKYKKLIPALALAVVIAGSVLAYDMLGNKNANPPGEYNAVGDAAVDSAAGREDMVAPLLNQFQLDGRHYILLPDDLKREYGLPAEIGDGDIGSKIAAITASPDPSLTGSEVYSYLPAGGEAVVAVKKDGGYQLFRFFTFESYNNNRDEDAAAYLKLYGIKGAEDIGKVQIIAHSEQSKLEGLIDIRGEITDPVEIAKFYGHYSVLKNAADKYFEALFGYKPADNGNSSSVEVDIAVPDPAIPPDAPPDAPDRIVSHQGETPSMDEPVSSGGGQDMNMDMGDIGPETGLWDSGSTQPSQGSAGNALADMVTVRIYNQNGIFYDTPYYRNIRFLSRYEVSEQFAAFLEGYME